MGPNRRAQERGRAAAERKAAAAAQELVSKAERAAGQRARKRRALIRDAVFAIVLALVLFVAWKLISWLALVVAVP
jgi:hypothetical protein